MRALVDTCVVIDVLQRREPFWSDSHAVCTAIANHRADGFLSAKSFVDIYYLTHRATHDDKAARKILTTLLIPFDLLDTTGMDCRRAFASDLSDYGDAIMVESALRGGMDCIVTRNIRDYQGAPLLVYTPTDFLALTTPTEE